MNNNHLRDGLFEALFRQAVIDNFEQQMNEMPPEKELARLVSFSDGYDARMRRLFARESRKERMRATGKWARRVAAAIAITITISSGTLMAVPEVRATVKGTVVQWFEQFTMFVAHGTAPIKTDWTPEYVPEGFTESDRFETDNLTAVAYRNNAGEIIFFDCATGTNAISVNIEGVIQKQIWEGGRMYHTFEANTDEHMNSIVWDMEGCQFIISAYLPLAELLEVALSVK